MRSGPPSVGPSREAESAVATAFAMPKLGLTMEAGTILRWLVDDGTEVDEGTPVLEIETDKVESEVEASESGRLHQIGIVGETYACGEQIGWFLAINPILIVMFEMLVVHQLRNHKALPIVARPLTT